MSVLRPITERRCPLGCVFRSTKYLFRDETLISFSSEAYLNTGRHACCTFMIATQLLRGAGMGGGARVVFQRDEHMRRRKQERLGQQEQRRVAVRTASKGRKRLATLGSPVDRWRENETRQHTHPPSYAILLHVPANALTLCPDPDPRRSCNLSDGSTTGEGGYTTESPCDKACRLRTRCRRTGSKTPSWGRGRIPSCRLSDGRLGFSRRRVFAGLIVRAGLACPVCRY